MGNIDPHTAEEACKIQHALSLLAGRGWLGFGELEPRTVLTCSRAARRTSVPKACPDPTEHQARAETAGG